MLVNNAGMAKGFGDPALETDPDDYETMLAVNLVRTRGRHWLACGVCSTIVFYKITGF